MNHRLQVVLPSLAIWLGTGLSAGPASCQEIRGLEPPARALPSQRMQMEQVQELAAADEVEEALSLLEQLHDGADGRLVPDGTPQAAGTLRTQRYIPLEVWTGDATAALLHRFPAADQRYQSRNRELAQAAWERQRRLKDPVTTRRAARRYAATEAGSDLQLLLCDLYLESGWGLAAQQAVERVSPLLRFSVAPPTVVSSVVRGGSEPDNASPPGPLPSNARTSPPITMAWPLAWRQIRETEDSQDYLIRWAQAVRGLDDLSAADPRATPPPPSVASSSDGPHPNKPPLLSNDPTPLEPIANRRQPREPIIVEAIRRMLAAAAMTPDQGLQVQDVHAWASQAAAWLSQPAAESLTVQLAEVAAWPPWQPSPTARDAFHPPPSTTSTPLAESTLATGQILWPQWSQALERFSANSDRILASKPRVGETERGTLPYFPVVHRGRVYVNELTRIMAYELRTGQPWPSITPPMALFDSQISPAAYLPLGYPLVGTPRGTLEVTGEELYARLGSPIVGRANSRGPAGQDSASYLVGLDLSKQGSLLPGFPLHLKHVDFGDAEFDGPPLVWGELLLVAIAQRDNVGLSRRLAAFNRFSGQLMWKSAVLAIGDVGGRERANLIAHQLLSVAGGRLFYNTNLGTIACLDPLTGDLEWLVQYERAGENSDPRAANRFRYRDLNPCLLSGGVVYCAPQDVAEIFALDASTGDLVWSTDDTQVADANQILGVHGDCLIVSGDRLLWLDRWNGRLRGHFPAGATPGPVHALPSPRGLGRGAIANDHVYWPVAGEVFVFPAACPSIRPGADAPSIAARWRMGSRRADGGNLLFAGGWMLFTSPSRLMAFPADHSR